MIYHLIYNELENEVMFAYVAIKQLFKDISVDELRETKWRIANSNGE